MSEVARVEVAAGLAQRESLKRSFRASRMNRIAKWSTLVLAIVFAACTTQTAAPPPQSDEDALRAATQHYAELVQRMDSAAIAAMFTPDGQLTGRGQTAVRGPAAIQKFLESLKDFHVESEMMTADSVTVDAREGYVSGTYHQRVRVPDGKVVEVGGTYSSEWLRDSDGVWRIQRMETAPQR